ncbi:FAD:protein FMN transferase [bacterium]|nr:FAD:protein FMN transferase [bacterium]MDB4089151.1 FAD:protein FMN transferase [Flavobacteriales bacterium]
MKKIFLFTVIFILSSSLYSQQIYRQEFKLMGCKFSVSVVSLDSTKANSSIKLAVAEMRRIENLISSWSSTSQTSEINSYAGIKPVKVDKELFNLIERSLMLSKLTDGAFDISYASMDKIWKFDGSMSSFPSTEKIKNSISKVGFKNIVLDKKKQTVFLKLKGMKIGFGAIGKGYAADKAKEILKQSGVNSGIINASGDMYCWGKKPNGNDWKIAITNPFNKGKAFATLPINDQAVVTSGNYEKFITFNNIRYAHIINPKTGYPTTGVISVTVFAPKAEFADALATSIFVMGKEVGLNRINQIPNVECIIIDTNGEIFTSNKIKIN